MAQEGEDGKKKKKKKKAKKAKKEEEIVGPNLNPDLCAILLEVIFVRRMRKGVAL